MACLHLGKRRMRLLQRIHRMRISTRTVTALLTLGSIGWAADLATRNLRSLSMWTGIIPARLKTHRLPALTRQFSPLLTTYLATGCPRFRLEPGLPPRGLALAVNA